MSLFLEAFAWLTDPLHWSGPNGVPVRVLQHLAVTFGAVAVASIIAIPIGLTVGHTRRGQVIVIALAGAARAIPTLGLLTVLGLLLGIGPFAPVIALIVLAVPSVLAGCYAGICAVDASTADAARAMGMSGGQVLRQVEIPLAAPVILGGIRAATLQVVATATLAAYTADLGLGRYLFSGLKTRDYPQMLAGAVLVIILALALETTLGLIQRRSARIANPVRSDGRVVPLGGIA